MAQGTAHAGDNVKVQCWHQLMVGQCDRGPCAVSRPQPPLGPSRDLSSSSYGATLLALAGAGAGRRNKVKCSRVISNLLLHNRAARRSAAAVTHLSRDWFHHPQPSPAQPSPAQQRPVLTLPSLRAEDQVRFHQPK